MKKSMELIFLAVVFLTVLVSGCAPASTPVPPTSTSLPTNTPTVTPTATLQPTATDLPTSTPLPTYTPLPELPPNAIDLQWITAYGLPGEQDVLEIHPTKDGGSILLGYGVLLKLRADGLILWQKPLGQWAVRDVFETSTGDYILAADLHWIKLDSKGDLLWEHTLGEPSYFTGPILRLVEESNGDIVVEAVGSRTVFNADGELLSFTESDSQTSPGNIIDRLDDDQFNDLVFVQTTADGGALVGNRVVGDVGDVASMVSYFLISRFSEDGSVRWQKSHGGYFGPASYEDVHAFETKSGDFIVAGTLDYYGNNAYRNDVWVLRLGSDGNSLWDKIYATEGQDSDGQDSVVVIQELSNGDLIFAGQTSGAGTGGQDMWVLKTNAQGEIPNCGLVFDGSAGLFGSFPEVETRTFEAERRTVGDASDAQVIPLCSPSPSPSRTPSTEEATISSTPAPEMLTPGPLTCQLNMNQNVHILKGTNVWSQPDVVDGSLIDTLPAETSVYVISAPAWGRIQETGVSGWWWEFSNESNGVSTGWVWEGRIEECN